MKSILKDIQELKKNHLKEKLIQISLDIKELENQPKDGLPAKEKDKEKLQKLNEKFCKLAEELSEITNN